MKKKTGRDQSPHTGRAALPPPPPPPLSLIGCTALCWDPLLNTSAVAPPPGHRQPLRLSRVARRLPLPRLPPHRRTAPSFSWGRGCSRVGTTSWSAPTSCWPSTPRQRTPPPLASPLARRRAWRTPAASTRRSSSSGSCCSSSTPRASQRQRQRPRPGPEARRPQPRPVAAPVPSAVDGKAVRLNGRRGKPAAVPAAGTPRWTGSPAVQGRDRTPSCPSEGAVP